GHIEIEGQRWLSHCTTAVKDGSRWIEFERRAYAAGAGWLAGRYPSRPRLMTMTISAAATATLAPNQGSARLRSGISRGKKPLAALLAPCTNIAKNTLPLA